jgi:hypothetical protein
VAHAEIDLPPLNREHLAVDSPPGHVREGHGRPHTLWQVCKNGFVLLVLEEANANVVLAQHGEVRLVMQLPRFDREAEHPLQHCQLAVDLAS